MPKHIVNGDRFAISHPRKIPDAGETMENTASEENLFHQTLDITGETCPMTFVRTRLALDRMAAGQVLLVKLRGEEPRQNVPRTAAEQGHAVLGQQEMPDGSLQVRIRKGGG